MNRQFYKQMNSCLRNFQPFPTNSSDAETIRRNHIVKTRKITKRTRTKIKGRWRLVTVQVEVPIGYFGPHKWVGREWDEKARVWRDRCERCGVIRVWNMNGTAYWDGEIHVSGDPSLATYLGGLVNADS